MPILGNVIPPSNALTPTTVTATGKVTAGAKLDMNGTEIILDADADTSITADTDDQIDIRIAGADDFRFTANTFSVLSGSTLNVDSGATIANSGTATGFGPSVAAAAGIMEANANFVDAVIFGPAMDPVDWSGRTAASTASLMLATIESAGGSSQLNIWDLTSTTIASATPLYTVAIGWTSTSIDASMGYVVIGGDAGVKFYDPHDGAWGQRTVGWPRYLSTSSVPALHDQAVGGVAAGFSDAPVYDPRTGGPLPSFGVKYTSGTKQGSLIKDDGNVWDITGAGASAETGCLIHNGRLYFNYNASQLRATQPISTVNSDLSVNPPRLFVYNDNYPYSIAAAVDKMSAANRTIALASGEGLGFNLEASSTGTISAVGSGNGGINASVTRAFNTGYYTEYTKGIWLANSKTVDRGTPLANTLTENGTVTEGVASTSTELKGYSGWSTDNYLSRAADTDFEFGTGSFSMAIWMKNSGNSATEILCGFSSSDNGVQSYIQLYSSGNLNVQINGTTATAELDYAVAQDDGAWHKYDFVNVSSTERYLYVNGALVDSDTTDSGTVTDAGALIYGIGARGHDGASPATAATLSLHRISAIAPTATEVRQMYDAEKGMFVASAKCLLQSGSTDAVLDVSVDPITSKVAVTQTDSQMIWDGLVMESAPAVNTGASEHNKLFGGDRVEINSVNLYATIAAKSLRGDLDIVRGLKAGLPAGVDLSKAKAWLVQTATGSTPAIGASFNIKSVTRAGTGLYDVLFAVPFKDANWCGQAGNTSEVGYQGGIYAASNTAAKARINMTNDSATAANTDSSFMFVAFGELENE